MKCVALLLAIPYLLSAIEVAIGTNLDIRLNTPVSTATSHAKDKVEAILTAPVLTGDQIAIGGGAALSGTVLTATPASAEHNASLTLSFTQITDAKHQYRLAARVYSVDNARETVDDTGAIQGISVKDTITGRLDQGLGKLGNGRYAGLAQILETAKGVLVKNADPNISFESGTEMTLRLLKPVSIERTLGPAALPPVGDDGHLTDLVNNQVWQTYAASPPRPSDVTNLMFIGDIQQIANAFQEEGWVGAQSLSGESKFETARAIIEQRGYKEAPVSVILLDERPPDFVFQKANNTFSARHHLRIWRSPDTYQGQQVWLGAATHDIGIDYSDRERTFIHKIDSNIDLERGKVVNDLLLTGKVRGVTLVSRPAVPTNFRNGTGDDVNTDARTAVLQF